jgi:HEAT repeat protein
LERDAANAEPIGGNGAPPSTSPFARIEDFDTTLYFMEESEVAYLRDAIREDFNSDLRSCVIAGLFDTFEFEQDPTVREELCGIFDQLLVTLLSNLQFRTAAYLLREAAVAAERAENLLESQQQRLLGLPQQMSAPPVLSQLLQVLEETSLRSPQENLNELFQQLHPSALETILGYLARTQNPELRALLEAATSRIVTANTGELIKLIGSEDELVAMGAIEDSDRDVRLTATRAVTERSHRAALGRVERVLKERVIPETGNTTEKAVFFEAYATLAGDNGIPLLDATLNPKGFLLARKGDTQTRAAAATALGKIGSERALDALRKAGGDKDVIVRTAATRALRGNE